MEFAMKMGVTSGERHADFYQGEDEGEGDSGLG